MKTTFKTANNGKEKKNRRTLKVLQEDTSYIKLLLTTIFKLSASFLFLLVTSISFLVLAYKTDFCKVDITLTSKHLCLYILSMMTAWSLFQSGADSFECFINLFIKALSVVFIRHCIT